MWSFSSKAFGVDWQISSVLAVERSDPEIIAAEFDAANPVQSTTRGLPISEREAEVLEHLALGLSNQEVADALFISIRTVTTHVSHIMTKLEARNRTEAAALWLQRKPL